jgi:Na+/H+ antiporter NhaD/arsenite permease-like protein
MILVEVARESGFFQFLAFKIVQFTKGKTKTLMAMLSCVTALITALLSDMLALLVLIPLTISACKMLKLNPMPYLIAQIIAVKMGAIIFLTSSISNIIISFNVGLSFIEFFMHIGLVAIILVVVIIGTFFLLFKKDLAEKAQDIEILLRSNAWDYVPNRNLLYKTAIALVVMIAAFLTIPSTILPTDIIALTVSSILLISSRISVANILKRIDYKLILYLMCVFVVTGGLEFSGTIQAFATQLEWAYR